MTVEEKTEHACKLRDIVTTGFQSFKQGNHYSYQVIGQALVGLQTCFKDLGYDSMNSLIRDIGKSRSICYAMIDYATEIVPTLPAHPNLLNIDVTRLTKYIVPRLRALPDEETRGAFLLQLDEIGAMTESDQKDEFRRLRGMKTHVDCVHDNTEPWVKCKDCGKFIKVT